ncbi:hypothetical protein E1J53_0002400 [Lewinella sp. W8]|nr:hypothetical protein [Lewinella sp. W8]
MPNTRISGNYSRKEQDMIRSYVLLVHAEIESFFEERAKSKVESEFIKWKNKRKRSNTLLNLVAFLGAEIDWSKKKRTDKDQIQFRLNVLVTHFQNGVVQKNNGIKPDNLFKLLLPTGLEVADFDPTWLIEMENFGKDRGTIAHQPLSVQNTIDKVTEVDRIKNRILPEIAILDRLLSNK